MTKQYRFKHSLIYAVLITTFSSIAVQTNAQDITGPIDADREFTEDSTIKSEIWGPKTLVYTTDRKTINLSTKNNSSLTITSTYDPEVLAENGGSISFNGFKDLSVSTGQGVFEVKGANSSIETHINGKLSLNSTNKDNFYLINSETGASINLNAGDVTLSGAQAINNFGITNITSRKDIVINTDGSNAIVNVVMVRSFFQQLKILRSPIPRRVEADYFSTEVARSMQKQILISLSTPKKMVFCYEAMRNLD